MLSSHIRPCPCSRSLPILTNFTVSQHRTPQVFRGAWTGNTVLKQEEFRPRKFSTTFFRIQAATVCCSRKRPVDFGAASTVPHAVRHLLAFLDARTVLSGQSEPTELQEAQRSDSVQQNSSAEAASKQIAQPSDADELSSQQTSTLSIANCPPGGTSSEEGVSSASQSSAASGLPGGKPSHAEEVWRQAWQALDPPKEASEKAGKPQRWAKNNPRSAHSLLGDDISLVSKPTLALQGLATPARAQLLALSLLALELQVVSLPGEFARQGTEAEWKLLLPALLASCSVKAAQGWLGYTPPDLQQEAGELIARLEAESDSYEYGLALPAWYSALALQAQPDSSSKQDSADGSSQHGKNPDSAAAESLWGAAAEKAGVHAIVLKHLLCQDSNLGFDDRGGPGAEARWQSTSQASASSAVRDDSEQGTEGAQDAQEPELPDVSEIGGRRERNSAGRQHQLFGWIFGSRRKRGGADFESGGTDAQGRAKKQASDQSQSEDSATRAAAMRMLQAGTSGIRGWGPKQGSQDLSAISPIIRAAPAVLQDMAVAVAEAVAAAYLAEAGLGLSGGPAKAVSPAVESGSWPVFLHPRLANTRALERFRNQVAFQQFVDSNWEAVAAIYEDRHLLWGVGPGVRIVKRSVSVRRAKDLQGLKGWRAAVSLLLEALDFLAPLLQRLGQRGSEAVSWLLVTLIGRSLGLVFRGIRQSLRPRKKPDKPARREGYGFV